MLTGGRTPIHFTRVRESNPPRFCFLRNPARSISRPLLRSPQRVATVLSGSVRKPPTGRAATVPMERPATAAYASRRRRFSLPQSRASESPPTAGACTGPANGRPVERSKQQSRRRWRSVPRLRRSGSSRALPLTSAITNQRPRQLAVRPRAGFSSGPSNDRSGSAGLVAETATKENPAVAPTGARSWVETKPSLRTSLP
jgi:hypothetical protein